MNPIFKTDFLRRGLAAGCLLGLSTAAWAHPGLHAAGALSAFAHSFTGADHLLAMLAVGAWAAGSGPRARWAPVAFVIAALSGALAGAAGMGLPAQEPLLALSVVLAGLVLTLHRAPSAALLTVAAAALGALHGNAHGLEVAGADSVHALGAFAIGSALLHALGYGAALAISRNGSGRLRYVGAAIAAVGGGFAIA